MAFGFIFRKIFFKILWTKSFSFGIMVTENYGGIFMKKIVSLTLTFVLLIGIVLTLVSCGGLSGTYEGTGITLFDLKFSGNKVTVIYGEEKLTGTYEIEEDDNGKKTISFDFIDEEDASEDEKAILKVIDKLLDADLPMTEKDGKLTIAYVLTFEKK